MDFEVKIFAFLLLGLTSAAASITPAFLSSAETFNQNLFSKLVASNDNKNIIYSPLSIQTSLAMTRMGADGQTAVEMDKGLGFAGQAAESVADNYYTMLAKYENSNILKIANKVYVNDGYQLQDNYKELLSAKFFSSAENINFAESEKAASAINSWVETKTENKIKDLVSPDSLDDSVGLVLLSAIHFNGKWATAFKKEDTRELDFYTDDTNSVKVPMMYRKGEYDFGHSRELEATVLRLPYKDSDLSMLIILPFSFTGLSQLEGKLKNIKLKSLGTELNRMDNLVVYLPKFKAEFEIELNDVLKKMGMNKMFGDADFGKMLKSSGDLSVSQVVHKAAIEVNEEGTEAAAATAVIEMQRMAPPSFEANHPFVYAIVNKDYVPLFQGTVVGF